GCHLVVPEVLVRRRLARPVPARHQHLPAHHARRGGAPRAADPPGRPGRARQAGPVEPPLRRLGREEVPEPGRLALRSHQRGQPRPHPRGAQVRRDQGDQVHLLRRVVDPPGDPPGARRAVAHRARPAQPGGHAPPDRQAGEHAPPGAGARGHARRDRRGDGHHRGGGRQDDVDLAGAPLARRAAGPGGGQQAPRLPARHGEHDPRRAHLREGAHRVDRGGAGRAQGARVEDPPPLLRPRRRGADDARGDRRAARHHPRARAADQGEGAEPAPPREPRAGAGELHRV
ncbi:MAG: RNA polymerase sigma factor RpoD, partial [uncultured Gemmatimonadaceae bacterium]